MSGWFSGQTPGRRQGVVLIVSVHMGSNHTVAMILQSCHDRHCKQTKRFCSFLQRFTPNMSKPAQCLTGSSQELSYCLVCTPTSFVHVRSNRRALTFDIKTNRAQMLFSTKRSSPIIWLILQQIKKPLPDIST